MLEPEIAALHDGAVDYLGVFVEPSLVLLRTSRIETVPKQVGDKDHVKVFANADAALVRGKRSRRRWRYSCCTVGLEDELEIEPGDVCEYWPIAWKV